MSKSFVQLVGRAAHSVKLINGYFAFLTILATTPTVTITLGATNLTVAVTVLTRHLARSLTIFTALAATNIALCFGILIAIRAIYLALALTFGAW